MKSIATILSSPRIFKWSGTLGRTFMKYLPFLINNKFNPWYKHRDMPPPPAQSFNTWYRQNKKQDGK
jgi:L-lactate dehydrogenase complex protein LldF